ncbi:hypothetical protein GQ53DRAFT_263632 [Thozetella sp. PMI_491]|nr:hypothetical protein GQ53DRAFT_263632 [Thozetella sp. PMI_491]
MFGKQRGRGIWERPRLRVAGVFALLEALQGGGTRLHRSRGATLHWRTRSAEWRECGPEAALRALQRPAEAAGRASVSAASSAMSVHRDRSKKYIACEPMSVGSKDRLATGFPHGPSGPRGPRVVHEMSCGTLWLSEAPARTATRTWGALGAHGRALGPLRQAALDKLGLGRIPLPAIGHRLAHASQPSQERKKERKNRPGGLTIVPCFASQSSLHHRRSDPSIVSAFCSSLNPQLPSRTLQCPPVPSNARRASWCRGDIVKPPFIAPLPGWS